MPYDSENKITHSVNDMPFVNNFLYYIFEIAHLKFYNVTGTYTDTRGMINFLNTSGSVLFVPYIVCCLILGIFTVFGFIMLIRELLLLKKRSALKKGDFEIGSVKAKILYFCFPVTLITVLLLTYATFAI